MKAFLICAAFILIGGPSFAQDTNVEMSVDWESGKIEVEISRRLPISGSNLPTAFARTRRTIEEDAHELILDALRPLVFDSLRTIDELLDQEPGRIRDLSEIASRAVPVDSKSSVDLNRVIVMFQLDLFADVIGGLTRHTRPISLTPELGWKPTNEYTGIIIYAAGELDVHGTDDTAYLRPALFPGLYYYTEDGLGIERLMEAGYVNPDFLERWGPVMYTSDIFAPEVSRRIGDNPLRIIAYGCFGRYPTDVVISNEDAREVLSTANNRNLIAEGRIAIIVGEENM